MKETGDRTEKYGMMKNEFFKKSRFLASEIILESESDSERFRQKKGRNSFLKSQSISYQHCFKCNIIFTFLKQCFHSNVAFYFRRK